jgi:hypothetical protein
MWATGRVLAAAGMTGLLLAAQLVAAAASRTVLTATPAHAAPAPAGGPAARAGAVPLTADLVISKTDGVRPAMQETRHVYRDSHGRTRVEAGTSVTITDPANRMTVRLDANNHTFQRSPQPKPDTTREVPNEAQGKQMSSPPRPLGTRTIQGVPAQGQSSTVTIPATNGLPARQKEVTTWRSTQLQIPVQTRVVEASGAGYTQTYTNIHSGSEPAAGLFAVPAGYHEATAGDVRAASTDCSLDIVPDPVVVLTIPYLLGYSDVFAFTSVDNACLFVADAAAWELPLWLRPVSPLLLPVDWWFARDTGLYPGVWAAFGDIAFLASNVQTSTVRDTLVILYRF